MWQSIKGISSGSCMWNCSRNSNRIIGTCTEIYRLDYSDTETYSTDSLDSTGYSLDGNRGKLKSVSDFPRRIFYYIAECYKWDPVYG